MNLLTDTHEQVLSLLIIAGEIGGVAAIATVLYLLVRTLVKRFALMGSGFASRYAEAGIASTRRIVSLTAVAMSFGVLAANGWLAANNLSISQFTLSQLESITG